MRNQNCPMCSRGDVSVRYQLGTHRIMRCGDCTMMWLDPMPRPDELEQVYDERYFRNERFLEGDNANIYGYHDYFAERFQKQQSFQRLVRDVKATVPATTEKPRLLDIGCGLGYLLDVAQDEGFDVQGIDLNSAAIELIRQKFRFPVQQSDIAEFNAGPFEVITMLDVIEHLADPFQGVWHINRLLVPGGLAVISTMDCDSLVSRLLGARLEDFRRVKEHLHFFTRKSLFALLKRQGFEVMRARSHGHTFRLDFLAERVRMISPLAGRVLGALVRVTRLGGVTVHVNPMTKFLVVARKVCDVGSLSPALPAPATRTPRAA